MTPISLELFSTLRHGTTKWDRFLSALADAGEIAPLVAHSVGDSLTYWRGPDHDAARAEFTAHRRYQTVFAPRTGTLQVELISVLELWPAVAYNDLSDRELLTGDGVLTEVVPGQVLAAPIDHAWRVTAGSCTDLLTARVTVEGATFHNK